MPFGNTTWNEFAQPNITGLYDVVKYANDTTGDTFAVGMLFSAFIVLFVAMRRYGGDQAFAASSFVTFALSIFLRAAGVLGDMWIVMFGMFVAVSLVVLWKRP